MSAATAKAMDLLRDVLLALCVVAGGLVLKHEREIGDLTARVISGERIDTKIDERLDRLLALMSDIQQRLARLEAAAGKENR